MRDDAGGGQNGGWGEAQHPIGRRAALPCSLMKDVRRAPRRGLRGLRGVRRVPLAGMFNPYYAEQVWVTAHLPFFPVSHPLSSFGQGAATRG